MLLTFLPTRLVTPQLGAGRCVRRLAIRFGWFPFPRFSTTSVGDPLADPGDDSLIAYIRSGGLPLAVGTHPLLT
jgi:hypothetical protein